MIKCDVFCTGRFHPLKPYLENIYVDEVSKSNFVYDAFPMNLRLLAMVFVKYMLDISETWWNGPKYTLFHKVKIIRPFYVNDFDEFIDSISPLNDGDLIIDLSKIRFPFSKIELLLNIPYVLYVKVSKDTIVNFDNFKDKNNIFKVIYLDKNEKDSSHHYDIHGPGIDMDNIIKCKHVYFYKLMDFYDVKSTI